MCIPKGAPHPDSAHAFIDYILDAEIHGRIASEIQNRLPESRSVRVHPGSRWHEYAIYPSDATLTRCEFATYKGEEMEGFYESALNRVLAGQLARTVPVRSSKRAPHLVQR